VQEQGGAGYANLLTGAVDQYFARIEAGGAITFPTDALGSTLALADETGPLTTQYTYEPFGKTTVAGAGTTNSFAYTGRELDGTGIYYYRARYYYPHIGRFVSEDPAGFHGSQNLYAYVGDDPINFFDPLGLIVQGTFNRSTGELTITDIDTGITIKAAAESGGKPWGDPIPKGTWDILERAGKPDFFRLDRQDRNRYDDIDDASGRGQFRLHRPGRTVGCIASTNWSDRHKIDKMIRNTKNTRR
jgi:RHS repeat-associated protein